MDLSHLTELTSSIDDIGGSMMIFAPRHKGTPSSFNRVNVAYFDSQTETWHCLLMHRGFRTFSAPYDFIADRIYFNGWNTTKDKPQTLYFPFAIPDINNLGKLYAYEGYDATTGIVTFNRVMQMEPHVPYIFIPSVQLFNDAEQSLYNIEVKNTNGITDEEEIGLNGVYIYKDMTVTANDNIYGFTTNGDFVRATGFVGLSPFIAYLKLPDGASVRVATSFIDADETSNSQVSIIPMEKESWYSLDGQAKNVKNLRKGVYMHNGKKVIIR